jgi:hypothetical protein
MFGGKAPLRLWAQKSRSRAISVYAQYAFLLSSQIRSINQLRLEIDIKRGSPWNLGAGIAARDRASCSRPGRSRRPARNCRPAKQLRPRHRRRALVTSKYEIHNTNYMRPLR